MKIPPLLSEAEEKSLMAVLIDIDKGNKNRTGLIMNISAFILNLTIIIFIYSTQPLT
jgi:hypothetical protein